MDTPPKDRTRGFKKGVPVMVSVRLAGGVDLLREPEYKQQFTHLLAQAAARSGTDIFAFVCPDNHAHIGMVQDFDGSSLTRGIGACVRNIFAPYGRSVNARGRGGGHVVSKPYTHTHLRTVQDVYRALAYINHQNVSHPVSADVAARWLSSWQSIVDGKPDGICTVIPEDTAQEQPYDDLTARLTEILGEIADRAGELHLPSLRQLNRRIRRQEREANREASQETRRLARQAADERRAVKFEAWQQATRAVLEKHGIDGSRPSLGLRMRRLEHLASEQFTEQRERALAERDSALGGSSSPALEASSAPRSPPPTRLTPTACGLARRGMRCDRPLRDREAQDPNLQRRGPGRPTGRTRARPRRMAPLP